MRPIIIQGYSIQCFHMRWDFIIAVWFRSIGWKLWLCRHRMLEQVTKWMSTKNECFISIHKHVIKLTFFRLFTFWLECDENDHSSRYSRTFHDKIFISESEIFINKQYRLVDTQHVKFHLKANIWSNWTKCSWPVELFHIFFFHSFIRLLFIGVEIHVKMSNFTFFWWNIVEKAAIYWSLIIQKRPNMH